VLAINKKKNLLGFVVKAIKENGGCAMIADLWTGNYKKETYLSCTVHSIKMIWYILVLFLVNCFIF